MPGKTSKSDRGLSRRDFARVAALAAATAALPSAEPVRASSPKQDAIAKGSPLTPAGEAQVQTILAKYGKRLSSEQKSEIRRLVAQAQKSSEALHSFSLDNSDEPAMIFNVFRSDRR